MNWLHAIKLPADYVEMLLCTGLYTPGVCMSLDCGLIDEYAGIEPDAEKYPCPDCGRSTFYGLEEALILGLVQPR